MTKFQITCGMEMCKFFEQRRESTSPFLEVPEFWKQQPESTSPSPALSEIWKQQPESILPLSWSARVLKNMLNRNIVLHGYMSAWSQ
jgi:hypothetical protein